MKTPLGNIDNAAIPPTPPPFDQAAWDTFAAAALTGLVASNFYDRAKGDGRGQLIVSMAAGIAAEYADRMMDARLIFMEARQKGGRHE